LLRKTFGLQRQEVREAAEICRRRSFVALLLTRYSGDQIKNCERDRACGTNGGEDKSIQSFGKKS
jgi:hypothetical protein